MKENFPIEKEFEYNKIGSWYDGNPYTIAFCYPKDFSPFIVKGGIIDVRSHIEKKMLGKAFLVYYTMFWKGKTRTIIDIYLGNTKNSAYLRNRENLCNKHQHYQLIVFLKNTNVSGTLSFEKWFRRPPRKWIKELNPYIV